MQQALQGQERTSGSAGDPGVPLPVRFAIAAASVYDTGYLKHDERLSRLDSNETHGN